MRPAFTAEADWVTRTSLTNRYAYRGPLIIVAMTASSLLFLLETRSYSLIEAVL